MKFSNVLFAVFGLTSFAAALPAPAAAPADVLNLKSALIEREALPALQERAVVVDLQADVQVCIDAVVAINKKYSGKKGQNQIKKWAIEVTAQIKVLIAIISAYPQDATYPSIEVCVSIFAKLIATIFVQLKIFIDASGLIISLLLTVDLLLSLLLGICGDLLNIIVALFVLIEVKIKVGISQLIINACVNVVASIYLKVLVKLLIKAGLSIVLAL